MTRSHRAIGIPLLIVLALLTSVLLAPTGGTHALWVDGETQTVGSVASDGIGVTAQGPEEPQNLLGTSQIAVQNTSQNLSGILAATPTVTPDGGDTGLADQVAVSYAECATGAQVGSAPLGPGEARDLCVTTTPQRSGTDLLRHHAGATVEVTSELVQTAVEAPSWSANAEVTTEHHIDFPRPTHPGPSLRPWNVCEGSLLGPATISWAWPDTSGGTPVDSPAVDRWAVQQEVGNSWRDIVTIRDGRARSAEVPEEALFLGLLESSWVRVVGYPVGDPDAPVVGTFQVRVTKVLDLVGISVLVTCGRAQLL